MKVVSVIIPTYSPSFYIRDCLDSISNQILEYDKFEILIILNGPKEPYWRFLKDILGSYAFQYRLLYSESTGVSNARNIGLEHAQGEYVAFIDDDDYISDSYLSELLKLATFDSIVVCNVLAFGNLSAKNFFLDGWLSKFDNYNESSDFCKYRSILSVPWAKLIPRVAIGNHRFDVRFANGEDALFVSSITNSIQKLKFVTTEAIYYVRIRQGSASRKKISVSRLFKDTLLLIIEYVQIYFSDYKNYNFSLFINRIPGVVKNFIVLLGNYFK